MKTAKARTGDSTRSIARTWSLCQAAGQTVSGIMHRLAPERWLLDLIALGLAGLLVEVGALYGLAVTSTWVLMPTKLAAEGCAPNDSTSRTGAVVARHTASATGATNSSAVSYQKRSIFGPRTAAAASDSTKPNGGAIEPDQSKAIIASGLRGRTDASEEMGPAKPEGSSSPMRPAKTSWCRSRSCAKKPLALSPM